MDLKIAEEFLDELFSSLEAQETQSAAVLQFLKDHGNATDEQLAPYMEQASKASKTCRWPSRDNLPISYKGRAR